MEKHMIKFVLRSVAIGVFLAFTAIAIWAADVSISATGNATRLSESDAVDAATSIAENGLEFQCSTERRGEVEDAEVVSQNCTGAPGITPINCTVVVRATCHTDSH